MKKKTPPKMKLNEMTTRELKHWLRWAVNEVAEYHIFILRIKEELKKR